MNLMPASMKVRSSASRLMIVITKKVSSSSERRIVLKLSFERDDVSESDHPRAALAMRI